jgi:hypothetical protein
MSAPKPVEVASPFGKFVLSVEQSGGAVHVTSSLAITRLRIPVAEYPALRAWCEQVDRALSQRLVVAPKG